LIKQEYPTIPEEAFLTSSVSVFDLFTVSQLQAGNIIRTIKGTRIYKEPEVNHKYIIGIDTAEGVENDYTGLAIIDATDVDNIEEVGHFSDNTIRPDQTADLAVHLAKVYNEAFIIPERNSSGLTTVLRIQELGYRNLFSNRSIDKKTQKPKNEYGWRTTSTNRDVMIDDFIEAFEGGTFIVKSPEAIQQMKTFVRKDNGRREHETGYHDDSLFSLFLALQGHKYHRTSRAFAHKPQGF
jgi:hypothetical protein